MKKIVAIVSGGLDSIGFLEQFGDAEIHALTFQYGQKATKEIDCAKAFLSTLDNIKSHKIVDISFMTTLYGDSNQLTSDNVKVADNYTPSVVVPLRNAIFSVIGMAYAHSIGADGIMLGSHLNDTTQTENFEPMYPDCTPEFFIAFESALNIGHFRHSAPKLKIITPSLLGQTKVDVVNIAYEGWGNKIFATWSCYTSDEKHCGECESCRNRKAVFAAAGIVDKTEYEV